MKTRVFLPVITVKEGLNNSPAVGDNGATQS